jgi:hypothetical protein
MNVSHVLKWCLVGTLLALGWSFGLNKALFAQPAIPASPAPANPEEGVQVLTRGPVHEAFAETVTFDPEPGIVAPKAPPAAIEEVPPEQRLDGTNVAWISGYWSWDDERNDFLWISGIWRDLPPGRQWVPGYWGKVNQGVQWTSGYWADAQATDVNYLPEPPATVEVGPNVPAPSPDQAWLPGCWVWQHNRYAWRPGFWAAVQPNWDWVPAHYSWAPRGYVFVEGYWDYSIARRGVLFAPVYFNAGVYSRRGFSYSPTTVIDLNVFSNHLFLRPRYQHYYFGDYYADNYTEAGFLPWFSIQANRIGYDPIYAHDRWQHRRESGWERRLEADFNNRRDHEDLRPPRTWEAQGLRNASDATSRSGLPRVALLLDDLRRNADSPQRFQQMNQTERQQYNQHAQDVQRFREERQRLERNAVGGPVEPNTKFTGPNRVKLPGSPIVGKPGADLGKDRAPPKIYVAPNPDPNVAAKQRMNRSLDQPQKRTVSKIPIDQPRTEPQQPPKVERQIPPPKAERQDPPPRGKDAEGPKQDQNQDKHQGNGKK